MKGSTSRLSLVIGVVLVITAMVALAFTGSDSPDEPGDSEAVSDPGTALPIESLVLDDHAVLMRITNHGDTDREIMISVELEGPITTAGAFSAVFYPGSGGEGGPHTVFGGSAEGWGPGAVGVQHDGVGVNAPFSLRDVYDVLGVWDDSYEATRAVSIEPGPHLLLLASVEWELKWGLQEGDGHDGEISWKVVHEDPEMYRVGYSNTPGQWEEVHTEVWSRGGGAVHATTSVEIKYSYASVYLIGTGHYREFNVEDGAGNECNRGGIPGMVDSNEGRVWFYPDQGRLTMDAMTISRYPPYLVYKIHDVPIDLSRSPECFDFE